MEGDKVWMHYMKVFKNFQFLSYQINLTLFDELWVAKSVQIDKIQTFWDEFEIQVFSIRFTLSSWLILIVRREPRRVGARGAVYGT
jgi:hypothetical protein